MGRDNPELQIDLHMAIGLSYKIAIAWRAELNDAGSWQCCRNQVVNGQGSIGVLNWDRYD